MIDNPKKSWSVGYKMKIDSNLDDLWNIITKPGHLELVHPFCKENYPIRHVLRNSKTFRECADAHCEGEDIHRN